MTTFPTLSTLIVTGNGEPLPSAFTKLYGNQSLYVTWGQSVDAAFVSLQTQLNVVASLIYTAPKGNYAAPPAGGQQVYSANGGATPWTTATFTGRLALGMAYSNYQANNYADIWDASNGIFYALYAPSVAGNGLLARVAVTGGVPSVVASGGNGYTYNSVNSIINSAVATSATTLRVTYNSTNGSDSLATYSGGTLTVATVNSSTLVGSPTNNRRGMLLGTTSWLAFGIYVGPSVCIKDRAGNGFTSQVMTSPGNSVSQVPTQDFIGGGFYVRTGTEANVVDTTYRPALYLEYASEIAGVQRMATLRVPAPATFAAWTSLVVKSSTLCEAQYKDASGNYYTIAASITTALSQSGQASGSLGLYGPFNGGNLGLAWSWPLTYNSTIHYMMRQSAAGSATLKLSRSTFNAANSGNEVISNAANDITIVLGAAQSSPNTAAIAGLTSVAIINAFMLGPDQLVVVYYAAATMNVTYCEVFTLS